MPLLGVCLEPAMCELRHNEKQQSAAQLSTQAKEFNPFASAQPVAVKEFNPEAARSEQAGILDMLASIGFDAQVDHEMGTVFVKDMESCTCCKGFINNCKGEQCQSLGMCFCMIAAMHDHE